MARIGQRIKVEKINSLTHNAGVISLAPSTVNVGGVQVDTDAMTRTISSDVTLVANTLYMIYVVLSAGVPVIRISTNVNSVGPSGFLSWKLVGAFYSNGVTGSIAFGSFVNIEGAPTSDVFPITPSGSWTTNTIYTGNSKRIGEKFIYNYYISLVGVPTAGSQIVNMPTNQIINTTKLLAGGAQVQIGYGLMLDAGSYNGILTVIYSSSTTMGITAATIGSAHSMGGVTSTTPINWTTSDTLHLIIEVPIVGLSHTPIKDL